MVGLICSSLGGLLFWVLILIVVLGACRYFDLFITLNDQGKKWVDRILLPAFVVAAILNFIYWTMSPLIPVFMQC